MWSLLQRRKAREEAQLFVVEGWRFVEEAVQQKCSRLKRFMFVQEREPLEWQSLQKRLRERSIPFEEVDERVLRKMSATEEPQGILAVVRQTNYSWAEIQIDRQTVLLILDGIQDPGNLGTILRTALASGVRYVCLTPGTVDLYNPKVLRSTMGALFSLVLLPEQAAGRHFGLLSRTGAECLYGGYPGQLSLPYNIAGGPTCPCCWQ